jgi:hypothetical protein
MNKQILIAASVGLSMFAAAQSQTDKQKPKPAPTTTISPRDASSGQASGRTEHLEQKGVIHRDLAARDLSTGHASGKTSAQDDWNQQNAAAPSVKPASSTSETNAQPRVAKGDVNGDGAAASKNSGHASESLNATGSSTAQIQSDPAKGQTTGKRQHQPVVTTKTNDKTPNQ